MKIYIFALFLSLFFCVFFKKYPRTSFVLAAMPFFIISAIRYDVGTDYMFRYVPDYLAIYNGRNVTNLELLFKLFVKICTFIAEDNYQILFVITSAVVVFGIFGAIYKYSKNKIFSIILFFICGYFFGSMNLVRQYVAMAILLLAYNYLNSEETGKWFLVCIIAFFIHSSSIILCILTLVLKNIKRITWQYVVFFVALYFILQQPLKMLIEYIMSLSRYSVYINSVYNVSEVSITDIIQNIIIYFIMYHSYDVKKKNNELNKEDDLLINLQFMTIIFILLGNTMILFDRVKVYFQIFQLISIPHFLEGFKIKLNKRVFSIVILILFTISIIRSNVINNNNEVVPYRNIWNKERELSND